MDKELNRIMTPIDSVISVSWQMRFFECGTFRAVFPLDGVILTAARNGEYLCCLNNAAFADGFLRCGRIEKVAVGEEWLEVSGRMVECLLADRVIERPFLMIGEIHDVVLSAVSENVRGLPLEVGEDSAEIEERGLFALEWQNLSVWARRVLKPYDASYTVTLDEERGVFVFRIVKGKSENGAVFSTSYGNVLSLDFGKSITTRKNKAYIEGADGIIVELDLSNGQPMREVYKKASDIRPDLFDTADEYRNALLTRAREVLAEYKSAEELVCRVSDDGLQRFGRDYYLGDSCYVADEKTGIYAKARIAGANEEWENGERALTLSLTL